MRIDIISIAPNLLESPFNHSIIKRAKDKGLIEIIIHDLRIYGLGNYKQIDDTQYGGGAGMVMMIEPIANCIKKLQLERDYDEIIYMTPDAKTQKALCKRVEIINDPEKNLLMQTVHLQ